jgi:DNA polymerase III subunit epsilon
VRRSWALGTMVGFDLETTGLDVETDRIVTGAAALVVPGKPVQVRAQLVAVDIDIPARATEIHGITTEHARGHGVPPRQAVDTLAADLCLAHGGGAPIITMNTPYDLTLLDRELRRYKLPTMEERLGRPVGPVIDVFIVDRWVDRYRRGKRRLVNLAEHYGVKAEQAHDATADALTATRVAYVIARRAELPTGELLAMYAGRKATGEGDPGEIAGNFRRLGQMSAEELHAAQIGWATDQGKGLRAHWQKEAREKTALAALARQAGRTERADELTREADDLLQRAKEISTEWPIRPHQPSITKIEQETLL